MKLFFLLFPFLLIAAPIQDKVLICGICRNVEKSVANDIASIEKLGSHFSDYRVIIYENNSSDKTAELMRAWAEANSKVLFLSENLTRQQALDASPMKVVERLVLIARARNKVLDVIMREEYEDYKYVILADLDFRDPWDIANIIDTIQNPEHEFDAVFANGSYDLLAFRSEEFPIGYELLGKPYWSLINGTRASTFFKKIFDKDSPWTQVYSAFGGVGIYKREAMKGCRYSATVTKDLERCLIEWVKIPNGFLLKEYQEMLTKYPILDITTEHLYKLHPSYTPIGMRLFNQHGLGQIAYFSCKTFQSLPCTCEHVTFHASMLLKGSNKIFINPRIRVINPDYSN
jgi:glycosyltransferase involved in cell wall biosynthesis